jgi:diguanylate cyclase (GGDEF)-like protein/PAS domain S-box-containing protein
MVSKAQLEELKAKGNLPSPKGVAIRVIELTRKDDVSNQEVARAIKSDPALSSQLIKVANALVAYQTRPIASILDAVSVLGFNKVRQLVLGLSVMDSSRSGTCAKFDYQDFWAHSLLTAITAQNLVLNSGIGSTEEVFILGLLGQIGRLALATAYSTEYARIISSPDTGLIKLEQAEFGFDHNQLTQAMLADWGMPQVFQEIVLHHEEPSLSNLAEDSRNWRLLNILHIADLFSRVCLTPEMQRRSLAPKLILVSSRLGVEMNALAALGDKSVQEWHEWSKLCGIRSAPLPPFEDLLAAVPLVPGMLEIDDELQSPAGTFYKLRVLLVDDDKAIQLLIKKLLEKAGHTVATADHGVEALGMIEQFKPQLIITDWTMPQMNGIEFCKALRQNASWRNIYVFIMTSKEGMDSLVEAFEAGANDYITKPVKAKVLVARLRAAQRVVQLQEELEHDRENLHKFSDELAAFNHRLRKSEVSMRAILENSPYMTWLKDAKGRYIRINNSAVDYFQRQNIQQVIGKTDFDLFPKALAEKQRREDDEVILLRQQKRIEESLLLGDQIHWLETFKTPVIDENGKVLGTTGFARDITERKKNEAELRIAATAFESQEGMVVTDADGIIIRVNQSFTKITGFAANEAIGQTPRILKSGRQNKAFYTAMWKKVHRSGAWHGEIWNKRKNGEIYPEYLTITAVQGADKEITHYVATLHDITERKLAEALLLSQKQFSDNVINSLPGIFYMLNQHSEVVRVNPQFFEVSGYTIDDLINLSALDLFAKEERQLLAQKIQEAFDTGSASVETEFVTKSGQKIPYYFTGHRTTIDNQVYIVGLGADISERKQAERALLRESEKNLALLHNASDGIHILDPNGNVVEASDSFCSMLGYQREEIIGMNVSQWDVQLAQTEVPELFAEQLETPAHYQFERLHRRRDGSIFDVEISGCPLILDGKQMLFNSSRDITERKQAEENLRITAGVFDSSQEAIVITDADNTIMDVNAAFTRITGYSRLEVLGKNPKLLNSGRQGKDFFKQMWQALQQDKSWRGEIWNRRKSGELYAEMLSISAICNNEGRVKRYVAVFSDISHIKAHEDELRRVAHYDALTGIPNRALLADRMKQSIAQTTREHNMMAVCYLDLDGFKTINDTMGHEAGDQVLIEVADLIGKTIRGADTVARIGGDEFVVLLLGLHRAEECVSTLERLLAAIAQPVTLKGRTYTVSASIGVSIYPLDEEDPDTLLRHADQAMYVAKQSGKNRFHIYDPAIDQYARDQHKYLERIRQALIQKEFVLHYQPKVNMRTGEIIGAEALIRWQHPEKGLLPPAEFLPLIEEHELYIEIGEWVIDTALTQLERWSAAGLELPVSVNVGAHQLQKPDFVHRLTELLAIHPDIKPGSLELEVLETSALDDLASTSRIIKECREIGVMFALDDFGTGYSSLTYLKALPASMLKIDQSFVRDMLDEPDDLAILEGVLGLATAFRRDVIAEGVETVEHGTLLLQLGCELAQGYGIARPMPAQDIPAWTTTWRPAPAWVNLPCVSRDDLPVLFASVEHRAWIVALKSFLIGERESTPVLNHLQCRFGVWLKGDGLARHAAKPAFHSIELLHLQVHTLATELQELHLHGRNHEALARLDELYQLRDALLLQLKTLVQ